MTHYFKALESLQSLRGFLQDDTVFRFAALPLADIDPPIAPAVLWNAAGEIESRGGIVRPLALVAAAVFARRGDIGEGITAQARHTVAVRDMIGAWGQAGGATAFALALATGDDDWPLAAWHATGNAEPEAIAAATEAAFRGLGALKFGRVNATQLAAQILALAPVPERLNRFGLLLGALRDRKQKWALMDAVAVAHLSLLPDPPAELARELALRTDAQLQGPDPPARMTATSLAALMVSRERSRDRDLEDFLTLRIAALVAAWRELGE